MSIDLPYIIDFLTTQLGEGGVVYDSVDVERYMVDWAGEHLGIPLVVTRPRTTQEVATVVNFCYRHHIRMVAQGGHTGLVGGALPEVTHPELVISLERLNQIRHLDSLNLTMAVDAGCVLQQVKNTAEAEECFFPLALGAQGSCQIGGNISTNAGGLNVLRYGMMRELVLGLEVVLPNGRIWDGMKALHKDNSGYDLKQMFIGAEGTLGIITGAVLKLSPRPQASRTALLAVPSVEAALQLYALARRCCCDLLSAFELIPRTCLELAFEAAPDLPDPLDTQHPFYVLLDVTATGSLDLDGLVESLFEEGLAGGQVLDGVLASGEAQASQLWQIREAMVEGQQRRGEHLRTDIALPLSSIATFFETATRQVKSLSPDATVIAYGHLGDGNLHFNILPPPLPAAEQKALLHGLEAGLFALVESFDGSISAEHGIGRTKQPSYLAGLDATEKELLSGLKKLFDPYYLMGVGRILPGPP